MFEFENIIKKAIEGGYDPIWNIDKTEEFPELYHRAVLDPLFWKALGKSCGWTLTVCRDCAVSMAYGEVTKSWLKSDKCIHHPIRDLKEEYLKPALRFHEENLVNGWESAVNLLSKMVNLTNDKSM